MKRFFTITDESESEKELLDFAIEDIQRNLFCRPGNNRYKIEISITDISKKSIQRKIKIPKTGIKKDSIQALKIELMSLVKEYVFLRDEHKCLICGSIDNLVLSHFIAQGSGNVALRSEVVNVTIACNKCNGKMLSASHRNLEFIAAMEEKFGEQIVLMLFRRKNQTVKWGHLDYDQKISYYEELIKDLHDEA